MTGKGRLPPAPAGEIVWVRRVAAQYRQFLLANPLDSLGIEARLSKRQAQQIERLIAMLVQRPQRAMEIVAADLKAELDGMVFHPLMKGLAVQFARAFVEQVGG